jgi:hypothetical protein
MAVSDSVVPCRDDWTWVSDRSQTRGEWLVQAQLTLNRYGGARRWRVEVWRFVDVAPGVTGTEAKPSLWSMPIFEECAEALAVGRAWCVAEEWHRLALEHLLAHEKLDRLGVLVGKILGE